MKTSIKGLELKIKAACGEEVVVVVSKFNGKEERNSEINNRDEEFPLDMSIGSLEVEYEPSEIPELIKAAGEVGLNYAKLKKLRKTAEKKNEEA